MSEGKHMGVSNVDAIWFACRSKACAPPPVGEGGSLDVAGSEMPAATKRKLTAAKKSKKSSGAKTATGSRKKTATGSRKKTATGSRKKTTKAVSEKLQGRIDALKERQEAIQAIREADEVTYEQAKRYYDASKAVADSTDALPKTARRKKIDALAEKAWDRHYAKNPAETRLTVAYGAGQKKTDPKNPSPMVRDWLKQASSLR